MLERREDAGRGRLLASQPDLVPKYFCFNPRFQGLTEIIDFYLVHNLHCFTFHCFKNFIKYTSFTLWVNVRGGFKKKKTWKSVVFCQTPPRPPPPRFGHFSHEKNWPPFFFLEIRPLLGETNFTLGPISKSIIFCSYNGFYNCLLSPQDLGRSGYFKSCPNSCRYEIGTPDQV